MELVWQTLPSRSLWLMASAKMCKGTIGSDVRAHAVLKMSAGNTLCCLERFLFPSSRYLEEWDIGNLLFCKVVGRNYAYNSFGTYHFGSYHQSEAFAHQIALTFSCQFCVLEHQRSHWQDQCGQIWPVVRSKLPHGANVTI